MEGVAKTLAANQYPSSALRFGNDRTEDNATFRKETRDGKITTLKLLGKLNQNKLYQPLRWSEATVIKGTISRFRDTRALGEGFFSEVVWDLTIPVAPIGGGNFKAHLQALFRRLISNKDVDRIASKIERAITKSKVGTALDGFFELKADLMSMEKSRPDAVRFSLEEGIIIGRREDGILNVPSN
jgi:hypothetical protein